MSAVIRLLVLVAVFGMVLPVKAEEASGGLRYSMEKTMAATSGEIT